MALFERDARQRHEHHARIGTAPRIAGDHLGGTVRAADQELTGRMVQTTQKVDFVGAARDRGLENFVDGGRCGHLVRRSGEDDALAAPELGLEIPRGQQVLVAVVAPFELLAVLETVVPVGSRDEFRAGFVRLEVEPRIRRIEPALHSARNGIGASVGLHVGAGQGVLVAEREEGPQPQLRRRMRIDERIADHELCAPVDPEQLLAQDHAAHAVGDRRRGGVLEIGYVLVAAGFVDPAETMQRQVERLVVLHDGLVERREQHARAVGAADRRDHQSVVFARVAADDRRAHVAPAAVRSEHLAPERIFEVAQFAFVKGKC